MRYGCQVKELLRRCLDGSMVLSASPPFKVQANYGYSRLNLLFILKD
jgi:hypothetical protein